MTTTIRASAQVPENSPAPGTTSAEPPLQQRALAAQLRDIADRLDAPAASCDPVRECSELLVRLGCFLGAQPLSPIARPLADNDNEPESPPWAILDQLPDATLVLQSGNIAYANQQFCEIMEYEHADLTGRPVAELDAQVTNDTRSELLTLLDVAQFEPMLDIPLHLKNASGESIAVSVSAQAAHFQQAAFMLLVVRDVSEMKRLLREAEAASASKSRFMANMTHEIRTPLSAIVSLAGLISETELNQEQQTDLDTIQEAATSLLALVNDILDLSRLEADHMSRKEQPCDLNDLIGEIQRLLLPSAQGRKLTLNFQQSPRLPKALLTDGPKVRQILLNLIGNAIKFTDCGGITVQLDAIISEQGPAISFEVKDTGPGIPKSAIEEIFRPFHQLDSGSNRRHEGSGLGLNISQRLAQLLGGQLLCTSELGKGSTFTLILPCDQEVIQSVAPESEGVPLTRYPILVAEDNPINQRVITGQLSRLGWSCALAGDGEKALEMLNGPEQYELILMDCQMPKMDGIQTTKTIRKLEGYRSKIPIIAVTANSTEEDRRACLESGMDDFMAKPIQLADLRERLQSWADESRRRMKAAAQDA